jgi:hypothetical protein
VAFSIAFGFLTKLLPTISDEMDHLDTQQRRQDCLDLTQSSHAVRRLSAKSAWQRGYSGPTHDEIVISRAYAGAVFQSTARAVMQPQISARIFPSRSMASFAIWIIRS